MIAPIGRIGILDVGQAFQPAVDIIRSPRYAGRAQPDWRREEPFAGAAPEIETRRAVGGSADSLTGCPEVEKGGGVSNGFRGVVCHAL